MSRKRRNWSPEEKAAVVLEIIREEGTLAEIAGNMISRNQC